MKNKFLLATAAGISLIAISEAGCTSCGNVNKNQQRSHQYNTMHRYNSFSHQGQEDRYITENDKQVLNQIRQILNEDQYSDLNIHATVEYGKVVLDGKTYSQGTKEDIQQQVANIQGVRHVIMDVYVDNRERKNPNGPKNQQNGNQSDSSRSWWQSSDRDSQSNGQNGYNNKGTDSRDSKNGSQNGWNKDSQRMNQSNGQNGYNNKGSDSRDSKNGSQNGWNKDSQRMNQSNGYESQSYRQQNRSENSQYSDSENDQRGHQNYRNQYAPNCPSGECRYGRNNHSDNQWRNDNRQQNRNNSQPYYYEDYQKENGSYDQSKSQNRSMNQNDYSNRNVSDSQLKSQIEKKLIGGWFSKSQTGVTVDVNNGIVTLSGKVDSHEDKQAIVSEIENMDGVQRVYNRVEIKQQGGMNRQDMNSPRNNYNNYRR